MISLQVHTYKGKWTVSYLDSVNWDNICSLMDFGDIDDMSSCIRANLTEEMGIAMNKKDATKLVVEAAGKYVEHLKQQSISWTYASPDPMERVYREALRIYGEAENVHPAK